jgi:hypothetical protein
MIPFIIAILFSVAFILACVYAAKPLPEQHWTQCPDCSLFWNQKNGRVSLSMPDEFDGVCNRVTCPDCELNFGAETITGFNERKGSEMPAARNGDNRNRQPVERHACAENTKLVEDSLP